MMGMDVRSMRVKNGAQRKEIKDQNGPRGGGNLKDGRMIREGQHLFVLNVDAWTRQVGPPPPVALV